MTRNKVEMVTISRAEYDAIQQDIAAKSKELAAKSKELAAKTQELTAALLQNEWLLEQLKLSKKKLFGQSSEKACEAVMGQLSFVMNEAEAIDAGSFAAESSENRVKAHTRKRRSGSIEDVIPEGLAGRGGGTPSVRRGTPLPRLPERDG